MVKNIIESGIIRIFFAKNMYSFVILKIVNAKPLQTVWSLNEDICNCFVSRLSGTGNKKYKRNDVAENFHKANLFIFSGFSFSKLLY